MSAAAPAESFFPAATRRRMPSKASTSQGIRSAPSCRNPNSSSASRSSSSKAQWPRYSVGITNRRISSPTYTAKDPLGTAPPPFLPRPPGATAIRFHRFSSCCSRTMSRILLLAPLPRSSIAAD
uniref:Uncharacterized protein n=1 Tax=Triticum urartu TaxID=4572 RepID=A0A8R7R344_TRIUA